MVISRRLWIAYWRLEVDPGTFDLPLHVHEHSDRFIAVLEGEGRFWWSEEPWREFRGTGIQSAPVRAGDVLVFTRNLLHTFSAPDEDLVLLSYHSPEIPFDDARQMELRASRLRRTKGQRRCKVSHVNSARIITLLTAFLLSGLVSEKTRAQTLRFDEDTDTVAFQPWCITVPDQITYEAIVRIDTQQSSAAGHLYTEHRHSWWDRQFYIYATGIGEYTHPIDQGVGWNVSASISPDVWHHLAFCYDGQQERMYLDGQLIGARANTGSIFSACGPGFPGGGVGNIGWCRRTDGATTSSFIGEIDSFRVSAIARYSGSSFAPPVGDLSSDADTVLLFNFNECAGTTVVDSGPLGRNGIMGEGDGATLPAHPPPLGDLDADGDVDMIDAELFVGCLAGPDQPNPGCDPAVFDRADIDDDGDTDMADFGQLQVHFGETCP